MNKLMAMMITITVAFGVTWLLDMTVIDAREAAYYPFRDTHHYLEMADDGFYQADDLAAPFAYRMGFTEVTYWLASSAKISTYQAFKLIAFVAIVLQLVLCVVIADFQTFKLANILFLIAVNALTFIQARYLLFDPIRPEPIAYILILVCFYLIYRNHLALAATLAIAGLIFREFLAAPIVSILVLYALDLKRQFRMQTLLKIVLIIGFTSLTIVIPRWFVPVSSDLTYVQSLEEALLRWTYPTRYLNIIIAIMGQMLPIILLITEERWENIKSVFYKMIPLIPYSIVVTILMFYGGTDLIRFASYFFIVQVILLGLMFKNSKIALWEFVYVAFVLFLYNRFWLAIPIGSDAAYQRYITPYYNDLHEGTVYAILALAGSMIGMEYLRRYMRQRENLQRVD